MILNFEIYLDWVEENYGFSPYGYNIYLGNFMMRGTPMLFDEIGSISRPFLGDGWGIYLNSEDEVYGHGCDRYGIK